MHYRNLLLIFPKAMTMFDENDMSKGFSTLKKKLFTNISLKIDNYRKEFNLSSFQMILQYA